MKLNILLLTAALAGVALPAVAQVATSRPQPLAPVDDIPAARDIPFAGRMTLAIDATDLQRGIYRVRQTVPVQAALANGGRMTMLYPEWLPGNHAPRGPISSIAGLTITANGQRIPWSRNRGYAYGFDFTLPAGAREVVLDYQHLSPTAPAQGREALRVQVGAELAQLGQQLRRRGPGQGQPLHVHHRLGEAAVHQHVAPVVHVGEGRPRRRPEADARMIERMQAVDTTGIEPMADPLGGTARLRDDVVTEGDQRAATMINAPEELGGLFIVPRVVE